MELLTAFGHSGVKFATLETRMNSRSNVEIAMETELSMPTALQNEEWGRLLLDTNTQVGQVTEASSKPQRSQGRGSVTCLMRL